MIIEVGKKRKGKIQIDESDYKKFFVKGNFIFLSTHKKPYVVISRYTGMKDGKMTYWRSYLHRQILNCPPHLEVDHINGDTTDCRRENLRACEGASNSRNKPSVKGKYKGVHKAKHLVKNPWVAQITKDYKCHHLGVFPTEEDAALAYNKKAKELHGKYAYLNVV